MIWGIVAMVIASIVMALIAFASKGELVLGELVIEETQVIAPVAIDDEQEWSEFHAIAVQEYADEFTAIFDALECKRAKNGRLMIRSGNSGSYKFAKKG
jgi:hypothetical protein